MVRMVVTIVREIEVIRMDLVVLPNQTMRMGASADLGRLLSAIQ